jgi:hypothetical protein
MKNGFCNHKDKHCEIVTEWKCVDIRYPDNITPDERKKRDDECRKKDWYGVCELCKYFKPDTDQPAGTTAKPADKPVYTPEKKKEPSTGATGNNQQGESWLEDLV